MHTESTQVREHVHIGTADDYRAHVAAQEVAYFERLEWTRQQIDQRLTVAAIKLLGFEIKPPELESQRLFWEGVRDGCNQRLREMGGHAKS